MEGLLSLMLFAGLFRLMVRFRCGAHLMYGGHDQGDETDAGQPDHVDSVCGMSVDPRSGYAKVRGGRPYRFRSRDCLDRFEAEPVRYAAPRQLEGKW